MRNLFSSKYMYLTAAMLTGAAMFTSCSNEDDMGNVNPTYDGESVKTQFAINIPAAKKADTRLGQDIVQGQDDPVFRGMSNIKLIPFNNGALTGTEAFTSDAIILKDITTATGGESLDNGAKFYSDIAVPVGTNRFLFYAEATPKGNEENINGSITAPTEFNNGDLLNGLTNLGNLKFTLTGIGEANNAIQTYLLKILNGVTTSLSTNAGANETLKLALTNIKNTKVGSSDAILAIMQDLYDIVKTGGTAANPDIASSITTYFTDGGDGTLSYKTNADGYERNSDNYPAYLGIPNGAAQVEWSTTDNKFAYTSLNSSAFDTYTYPASLYYYRESELGASDQTHGDSWNGSSISDWNTFVGNTNYPQTVVSSSTQSIVLKSAIQYAVAQLVYNVKFATDELADAQGVNRAIGTENFKLKGILIGGQKGVNFEFEQDGTATSKTIYDPLTTATAITKTSNTTNFYSLALQSELRTNNAGDDDQKAVSFALEFLNNGEDFYGKDGIVPKGGTFYLVGQLETKQTDANIDAVFKKDYKTVANVTINSLKDAQYTIPDLRKTELELGLYVDLNWTAGLSQDVTIQ